jgi:hypothetical protein
VNKQHNGSSNFGQWPNSAGTHQFLGPIYFAVGSTLWLNDGSHISPPKLRWCPHSISSLKTSSHSATASVAYGFIFNSVAFNPFTQASIFSRQASNLASQQAFILFRQVSISARRHAYVCSAICSIFVSTYLIHSIQEQPLLTAVAEFMAWLFNIFTTGSSWKNFLHRPHRKQCIQLFFVAMGMSFPTYYLTVIGLHTERPKESRPIRHRPQR